MTVSKRTRFEVLRRDDNTCRYCGGRAPDVKLTIDHVTPVSLGGSDDPSNLVAACVDCNAGKSSSNPDGPLVAGVSDDALRWASAMREVADRRAREQHDRVLIHDRFLDVWETTPTGSYREPELPDNWWDSVQSILNAGLPEIVLHEAVRKSFAAQRVSGWDKFRYMCGICWRQITEMQAEARASLATDVDREECVHCGDVETCVTEAQDCPKCGQRGCPYLDGYEDGDRDGQAHIGVAVDAWKWGGDQPHRILMAHVDGRTTEYIESLRWVAA